MKWQCQVDSCDVEGDAVDAAELDAQYADHYNEDHARQGLPPSVSWVDEGGDEA